MALSQEDLAAIAQMIAANTAAQQPTPPAPEPAAPRKAKGTAAKATAIRQNVNHVDVPANDRVTWRVSPRTMAGGLLTGGARVFPFVDGKIARSMSREILETLTDDVVSGLLATVEKVDKAARIGAHRPTADEREAAKSALQS